MKPSNPEMLNEILNKYEEHIEMMGKDAPMFVINILCGLLNKEKELNLYYKRRLEHVPTSTAN